MTSVIIRLDSLIQVTFSFVFCSESLFLLHKQLEVFLTPLHGSEYFNTHRAHNYLSSLLSMMLIANLAAAAVTAVLAVSSGRNMIQTFNVARQDIGATGSIFLQPTDSTETVISKMQSMKRKDLLELYLSSRGPKDMAEIEGEWDAFLLDNQGWVLVRTVGVKKHCDTDMVGCF